MTSSSTIKPITETDGQIAKAIADAHLPSLIAAAAHISGDLSLLRSGATPVYDFFGDGQGGFTPEKAAEFRAKILEVLNAYRDGGCKPAPAPDEKTLREMMTFVAGAEMPDRYVPFLEEEMEFAGRDERAPDWGAKVPDDVKKNFKVLIVGAGMSGILAAIRLNQAGVPFVIVDKNKDVAGTWLVNTYPGCRVDNPNHMYCYSFEPNHDWPQHYSTQPVLDSYFRGVAEKYGIREQVRFETEVSECVYDEKRALWTAHLSGPGGKTRNRSPSTPSSPRSASCANPNCPTFPGVGTLQGPGVSFRPLGPQRRSCRQAGGRDRHRRHRAFQFVPEIAPKVKHLTVFQRTPPWLGPTPNYHDDVGEGQKWLLKHVPTYAQWYRFWIFWMMTDGILPLVKRDPNWTARTDSVSAENDMLREMLTQYMQAQVADRQDLKDAVVPKYPMGGKRSVRDNGVWLSALKRDNVELVTDAIAEITPTGLRTKSGREIEVDVLIYGTGFQASHFLEPMRFKGKGGQDLHEMWDGDPRAYLGITVPNFPNLFIMYGPNTNIVVNGSIIFFSECEMRYIMGCLDLLLEKGHAAMEVKKDVHDAFNEKVDAANEEMAWGAPQVSSWYKNEKGRVTQNWPFLLVDYWEATRAPNPADYQFQDNAAVRAAE